MEMNDKKMRKSSSDTVLSVQDSKHLNKFKNSLDEEIAEYLLKIGFTIDQIYTAFDIYRFQTIESAIHIMMKDTETNLYIHQFINLGNYNCKICGQANTDHYDFKFHRINQEQTNMNILDAHTSSNMLNIKENSKIFNRGLIPCDRDNILVNIPKSVIEDFENPLICSICFHSKLDSINKVIYSCKHEFCKDCVQKYLSIKITNGDVIDIKCLQAGCKRNFTFVEIKPLVSSHLFRKFTNFYSQKTKLLPNNDIKVINCPFPDCQEVVEIDPSGVRIFVVCLNNHKSCTLCKQPGWHNEQYCQNYDNSLLKQIQNKQANGNYKQCPNCKVVIQKNEGCNHIKCLNCGFEFCWLCKRVYADNHYSVYNFTGCPGLRYDREKNSCWENKCVKCLWWILSCILGVLAVLLIITFYIFFGCPYEFIKCYLNKSYLDDDEKNRDRNLYQQNNHDVNKSEDTECTWSKILVCVLLAVLGVFLQPAYVLFYILYGMIQLFRECGCWIFMASY